MSIHTCVCIRTHAYKIYTASCQNWWFVGHSTWLRRDKKRAGVCHQPGRGSNALHNITKSCILHHCCVLTHLPTWAEEIGRNAIVVSVRNRFVVVVFQNMGPLNIANTVWHVRLGLAPWMLADIMMCSLFFFSFFLLLKKDECTNQKKKVLCRVRLRVGVMCVPCSEYLHLLSWLNREAGALTQSASEDEEEQRAHSPPLPPSVSHEPLSQLVPPLGRSSGNVTSSWIRLTVRQRRLITEGVGSQDTEGHPTSVSAPTPTLCHQRTCDDLGCQVWL